MKKTIKYLVIIIITLGVFLGLYNNVNNILSKEDIRSISYFIEPLDIDKIELQNNYEYQIEVLEEINNLVQEQIKPSIDGIPRGESREPKEQIALKYGQCYDRSRLQEKICKHLGFKTRHLFIIKKENKSFLKDFFSSNSKSHATSEIKTIKGWLVLDSNFRWISVDENGDPISVAEISSKATQSQIPKTLQPFYSGEKHIVYGLYSRHGMFYPPFLPIPDYNLKELTYNLFN